MVRHTEITFASLFTVFLCAGLIAGCDNTLNPVDRQRGFYSIYGTLNMGEEANYIRVKDLNEPLAEGSGEELDVTVRMRNLDRDVTEVLEDSVIRYDGVYTHNFRTTMEIRHEERYRVTVEGPDGNTTEATTEVPPSAGTAMAPRAPNCLEQVEMKVDNVADPSNLFVSVAFEFRGDKYWENVQLSERQEADEAVFMLNLKDFIDSYLYPAGYNAWCHHLSSDSLYMRFTHYSPDYFDQVEGDTLELPGGAGRFGALYEQNAQFKIDTTNVCEPRCGSLRRECFPDCTGAGAAGSAGSD